ncbi:RagB/SusD family nutrient uptake outer membrane protein [Sphingobacteriaceae bacterium WQ 2009]|uniref:RagB/SusD family nutrient uptake outer membrane protein n=1 Tax=Rhinopithecimicrobium faecis TaxID=2820698 RepID=A0A8T4HDN1_9SPHI|nr:RagB/SusD family nutrient uptake outer membrane protein [Sphingobacteriaceae bacterium WQ 2009]
MNTKFNCYLTAAVIACSVGIFTSCNKLDITPTDTLDPSKAYRNLPDINQGILGAYAALDYTLIANTVTVADEAVMPTENAVSNSDAYRWLYTPSSSSVTAAYQEYYLCIDRINRTLAGLAQLPVTDVSLANAYEGELLALRAFAHLELLKAYAAGYEATALAVPYMRESVISLPKRHTVAECMAFIKVDLESAINLLPRGIEDPTRVSQMAAYAILARAALFQKDWELAALASTEVIKQIPLATKTEYPLIWKDKSEAEVIWKLARVGTTDSRIGSSFYREDGGIVLYAPSQKLIKTFDKEQDVRYKASITFDNTRAAGKSPYLIAKWLGGNSDAPGLADIKLFRSAEAYLIRAEAYAEQNKIAEANADIVALRKARITGYTAVNYANRAALIQEINNERYKEFAFEGHRFFDLKRHKLPVERSSEDAANTSGALTLRTTQAAYHFPIPADEISVNKNTVQNPNY